MSRYEVPAALIIALLACPATSFAQSNTRAGIQPGVQAGVQAATPPERIDLLATTESEAEVRAREECENRQRAEEISGEIVVCAPREDDAASAGWDREDWENRYAAETRGSDPTDVDGPGIFRGAPTIGGLCIPGLQKCPPPPAIVVDFAALPEAPPGSDADRIARGLPPRGNDGPAVAADPAPSAGTLGLPPVPDFASDTSADDAIPEPVAPQ